MNLSVDGHDVYAYTGARAYVPAQPSVLLLHVAGLDHTVWILQSRYLAHHGYNVLALDLPGHGRSGGAPPVRAESGEPMGVAFALLQRLPGLSGERRT